MLQLCRVGDYSRNETYVEKRSGSIGICSSKGYRKIRTGWSVLSCGGIRTKCTIWDVASSMHAQTDASCWLLVAAFSVVTMGCSSMSTCSHSLCASFYSRLCRQTFAHPPEEIFLLQFLVYTDTEIACGVYVFSEHL